MNTPSIHERNIIDIALNVAERSIDIIYNHPEEPTYVHVSKKLLVDNIKRYFVSYLKRYIENPDFLISIRWFYTQKLLDFNNIDPLLPYNNDDNEGLYYELEKINVPINEIKLLADNVHNMIINFDPKFKDDIIKIAYENNLFTLRFDNIEFKLTQASYKKLKLLYIGNPDDMIKHIFNLLCRYESLSSPGYHASIPDDMAKLLRDELQVSHQLFASPFNCDHMISYTSAYPDTDKLFGSKGNFFQMYPQLFEHGGSFEANPPFLEEHMAALSIIIERSLDKAVPLSFFVVYPSWTDAYSYRLLLNSRYNILSNKVLNFEGGDHSYIQSSQYWIRGMNRKSNSRSSIFILQNELGKSKYKITELLLKKIIDTFRQ